MNKSIVLLLIEMDYLTLITELLQGFISATECMRKKSII